jgi:protein tyrosine phosphatase
MLNHYINASYIMGPLPDDKDLFIATQGPVTCTIEAFWKMVLIKNTKLIIMLTNLKEENRNKCDLYWPSSDNKPISFEKYKIHLETEVIILDKAIIQRNFLIENESENTKHYCTQLHVICWEDHSAPQEELGFKMIELILSYVDDARNENKNSPVVVHCR